MIRFPFPRLTAAALVGVLALSPLAASPAAALDRDDRTALGLVLGLGALAAIAGGDSHSAPPRRVEPPRREPAWGGPVYRDRHRETCVIRIETDRHGRRTERYGAGCDPRRDGGRDGYRDRDRRDWGHERADRDGRRDIHDPYFLRR